VDVRGAATAASDACGDREPWNDGSGLDGHEDILRGTDVLSLNAQDRRSRSQPHLDLVAQNENPIVNSTTAAKVQSA
jgi:hypothetical protein